MKYGQFSTPTVKVQCIDGSCKGAQAYTVKQVGSWFKTSHAVRAVALLEGTEQGKCAYPAKESKVDDEVRRDCIVDGPQHGDAKRRQHCSAGDQLPDGNTLHSTV